MRGLPLLAACLVAALAAVPATQGEPPWQQDPVELRPCANGGFTVLVYGNTVASCLGHELYRTRIESCGDGGRRLVVADLATTGCIEP